MSTRSLIGIANENDTVTYVYCHFDGYVKGGVGEFLIKNYSNKESVTKLIGGGDMSSLGSDGVPAYYADVTSDEDYLPISVGNDEYELGVAGSEYVYLFEPVTKTWIYKSYINDGGSSETSSREFKLLVCD